MNIRVLNIIFLLPIPFILGWLINNTAFSEMWFTTPITFTVIFFIFWTWAGAQFTKLGLSPLFNFLIGNSLTILSFLLYYWSFFIAEEGHVVISILSQLYAVPAAYISSQIVQLIGTLSGGNITFIPYLLMFIFFSIGFGFRTLRPRE